MHDHFHYNTGKLAKFIGKREIVITLIWFIISVALSVCVIWAFENIFQSGEQHIGIAETMKNPAMTVMVGPAYGIDNYNTGAMMGHMMLLFSIIGIIIMNIFMVVRHTRSDEEKGRLEVIRSLPVGRLANLSATMIVCFIINTIIALALGVSISLLGVSSMTLEGCMLFGVVIGMTGILFGAITAVFVQLSSNSRGAIGYSFMFLGIAYIVRGIGDVSSEILSLISPLGLPLRTSVFVDNSWWPILLIGLLTIIVLVFAFYLNAKRDLGEGLIPAKKGKAIASQAMLSPFGFARKLLRTQIIWWAIALFTLGVTYGSVFGDIDKFLEGNEMLQQMFVNTEGGITIAESFMSVIMVIMSIVSSIPAISAILRIRKEEKEGRLEHILSRNVSRNKFFACFLIIAIFTSIIMMIFTGLGLWLASYPVMAEPMAIGTVISSAVVHIPAIMVMIGIAMILITYLPRHTGIVWGYLGFSFLGVYLGSLLDFPKWFIRLSPYGNVPQVPAERFSLATALILIGIATTLFTISFIGYKRRDIAN